MKKILLIFGLLLFGLGLQAQNIRAIRVKTDTLYIQKAAVGTSDTLIIIENGKVYYRLLSGATVAYADSSGLSGHADTSDYATASGYADSSGLSGYADTSGYANNSALLQTRDTIWIYEAAAGLHGTCNNHYFDTAFTCAGELMIYQNVAKYSLFAGDSSGLKNTGEYNAGYGWKSLRANTTGYSNTASGYQSLYFNTTGHSNTTSGSQSLYSNTVGLYNTASGYQSLISNTAGQYNTTSGVWSLRSNTTGNNNTASGIESLYSNTTGNYNAAFGVQSLYSNDTGHYNIGIGNGAGYRNTNLSYRHFIGSRVHATIALDTTLTPYYCFEGGAIATNYIYLNGQVMIGQAYRLPYVDGAAGEVLTTDGSGAVSWAAGGGSFDSTHCWQILYMDTTASCSPHVVYSTDSIVLSAPKTYVTGELVTQGNTTMGTDSAFITTDTSVNASVYVDGGGYYYSRIAPQGWSLGFYNAGSGNDNYIAGDSAKITFNALVTHGFSDTLSVDAADTLLTIDDRNHIFVVSSGAGDVDLDTIAGGVVGATYKIWGTDDTKYVTINHGNNIHLNNSVSFALKAGYCIELTVLPNGEFYESGSRNEND